MSDDRAFTPPASISAEDWARTPASVQVAFIELTEGVAKLEAMVADLLDRLKSNSSNSSKPPSSDFPKSGPRIQSEGSGRRPGGQKGHPGSHRQAVGADLVTGVVLHFPEACEYCGGGLNEEVTDQEPAIHQVTDIPFSPPQVVEHRRHRRRWQACSKTTLAKLPEDVTLGAFGVGVQAAVAYYTGARRCSLSPQPGIPADVERI